MRDGTYRSSQDFLGWSRASPPSLGWNSIHGPTNDWEWGRGRLFYFRLAVWWIITYQSLFNSSSIENRTVLFWQTRQHCTSMTLPIFLNITLREILLVVLTKTSQLYIFSKRYQKFCKIYQYLKVVETKYATKFFSYNSSISSSSRNEKILLLALPSRCLRVRKRKAAQFFVSGVKNEQRSRGIGE